MRRVLLVLMLACGTANGEVIEISSGFYDQVNINDDRELLMTGGTIGFLNATGGLSVIHDGAINSSRIMNGAEVVLDGTSQHGKSSTINLTADTGGSKITIHGYHFRMYTGGQGNQLSFHNVECYLLDGTFAYIGLGRRGIQSQHRFELVKHDPIFLDPTRDWDFTLEDLNALRNSFGEQNTELDTNFDGTIDLADINLVRNHFGDDFYYTPDMEWSGIIPPYQSNPVPEPSTFLIVLILLPLLKFVTG